MQEVSESRAGSMGKNLPPGSRRVARITLYYLASVLAIYYFIMVSVPPVLFVRNLNNIYATDSTDKNDLPAAIASDSLYLDLSRELSFTMARIRMASSDSICLSVDIPDSTLSLEIRGVTVRSVKMQRISVAGSMRGVRDHVWHEFLGAPLSIESSVASIPREPIMLKIAPRDTAEASSMPDIRPDTTNTAPVTFSLRLENGIRLTVIEDVAGKRRGMVVIRRFLFRRSIDYMWVAVKHVALFRFPPYEPEIRLVVPGNDARTIYRALPVNGSVALRIR